MKGVSIIGNNTNHQSISTAKLKVPPTLIDKNIKEARQNLSILYNEAVYFSEKSIELMNGYPLKWNMSSPIHSSILALMMNATNNVHIINRLNNGTSRICYNATVLSQCPELARQMISELAPMTIDENLK